MSPFQFIDQIFAKDSNTVRELLKSILIMVAGAAVMIGWFTFIQF
jgi:hypothetical protein